MWRLNSPSVVRNSIPMPLAHESYRMIYEVQDDTVWILALVHTARLWPR